jgi:hypothetical protein
MFGMAAEPQVMRRRKSAASLRGARPAARSTPSPGFTTAPRVTRPAMTAH